MTISEPSNTLGLIVSPSCWKPYKIRHKAETLTDHELIDYRQHSNKVDVYLTLNSNNCEIETLIQVLFEKVVSILSRSDVVLQRNVCFTTGQFRTICQRCIIERRWKKLQYVPDLKTTFPNFTRKKSDAISISLEQQTLRDFDFLSPALNIFLKG